MTMSSSYPNAGQPWPQQQQHHHQQQATSSSSPTNPIASPVLSKPTSLIDENVIVMDYNPPGIPCCKNEYNRNNVGNSLAGKRVQWVYNPVDGSVLTDHNGIPLSVDRLLATKPLRHELSTRPGPGNKKLTYISGDDVSRTLNDIFGFDGWDLDIQDVSRVDASRDPKTGKHTVVYTARVRVTHKASGTYKEDCGAGDSTDRVYATAIGHALKASITDAMKRAARHFGDKLGNSLYSGNFSISKAPVSLKDALDKYDIHRCNTKFGFQKPSMTKATISSSPSTANIQATSTTSASTSLPPTGSIPPPQVEREEPKRHGGEPSHSSSSTMLVPSRDNNNIAIQQYKKNNVRQSQHNEQQQQHQNVQYQQNLDHPKQDGPKAMDPLSLSTTASSHMNQQKPNCQSHSTKFDPPKIYGPPNNQKEQQMESSEVPNSKSSTKHHSSNCLLTSNNYQPQQKRTSNPGIPNFNRQFHPQSERQKGSFSDGMTASAINPSTSSYERRPAVGSNISMNTRSFIRSSDNIASSENLSAPAAEMTGSPFNPNNNSNSSRRISLDKNVHQPQQKFHQHMSMNTFNSTIRNGDINAHTVSQTPAGNVYSNPKNKRPPLGAIVQHQTTHGVSLESSSKRHKQQRNLNPYNQSLSGRKSI